MCMLLLTSLSWLTTDVFLLSTSLCYGDIGKFNLLLSKKYMYIYMSVCVCVCVCGCIR